MCKKYSHIHTVLCTCALKCLSNAAERKFVVPPHVGLGHLAKPLSFWTPPRSPPSGTLQYNVIPAPTARPSKISVLRVRCMMA